LHAGKVKAGEKTMKVLLTGGSGNLGQALVPRLVDKGDLALPYGLDPAAKPTRLAIPGRWLGYKPAYSLANLLSELAALGDSGPRTLSGTRGTYAPAG
jgi:NAD(P)-dependent dehydrogenase (short-subunit alcohol dehydrogenase family)